MIKKHYRRKIKKTFKKLSIAALTTYFLLIQSIFWFNPLTFAASSPWTQTDWSGGSGQTTWSDQTKYDSGSGTETSTAGVVTLAGEELSNTNFETNLDSWDSAANSLATNLQAYWKTDESSGNSLDSSGNSNTITVSGSNNYAIGIANNAFRSAIATTNYIYNPSAETNTTNWNCYDNAGSCTLSRITSDSNFGTAAFRVQSTTPNPTIRHRGRINISEYGLSVGSQFCYSAYFKVVAGDVRFQTLFLNNVGGLTGNFNSSAITSSSWARSEVCGTVPSNSFTVDVKLVFSANADVYFDGVQFEPDVTTSTPYLDGSFGTGYSWSGTAHGSTSSRSASSGTTTSNLNNTTGAISFWFNSPSLDTTFQCALGSSDGDNTGGIFFALKNSGVFVTHNYAVGQNITPQYSNPILNNTWYHAVYSWNNSTKKGNLYINSALAQEVDYTQDITIGGHIQKVGTCTKTGFTTYNGKLDEIAVWSKALTPSDIAILYNGGNPTQHPFYTTTRDTSTTYSGSGGSAKVVATDSTNFTQSVNVGGTNNYSFTAYAYTDGSAVTSSDVELFSNGSTISTSYSSIGGGWYKLTGNIIGSNTIRTYGVQIKAGKTAYLDNFSLTSSDATLTSSIFSTGFSSGATFGTLTYTATTPTNTSIAVRVRSSNSAAMDGATDFSSCSVISSGTDLSSNTCITDGHRYLQYQLTLSSSDAISTPTFQDISIDFTNYRTIALVDPGNNTYTNATRPTFRWKVSPTDLTGFSSYSFMVDNGDKGDFTISGIPVNRTTDYETTKYIAHYENFSDNDPDNNHISLQTKSTTDWNSDSNSGENDGQLKEGRRTWTIKASDASNEISTSRNLFVDLTGPRVELNTIDAQDYANSVSTTNSLPTITGKIIDPLSTADGNTNTQHEDGPRVASGPREITIKVERIENDLPLLHTIYTLNLNQDNLKYTCDDIKVTDNTKQRCDKYIPFSYTQKNPLFSGSYLITITGRDNADNSSVDTTFMLNLINTSQINTSTPTPTSEVTESTQNTPIPPVQDGAMIPSQLGKTSMVQNLIIQTSPLLSIATNSVNSILNFVSESLVFTFNTANSTLAYIFNLTDSVVANLTNAVGGGLALIFDFTSSTLILAFNSTISTLALTLNALTSTTQSIASVISDNYNQLAQNAPGIASNLLLSLGHFVSGITNTTSNVLLASTRTFTNLINQTGTLLTTIASSVGKGMNTIGTLVATGFNDTKESFANLAFVVGEKTQDVSNTAGLAIIKFTYNFVNEPTTISNVKAEVLSTTSVKITWETNHPANGKVNWGFADGEYDFEQQTDKRTNHHEFVLTNLKPDTRYHYEVMSQNKNYVYDANRQFSTLAE